METGADLVGEEIPLQASPGIGSCDTTAARAALTGMLTGGKIPRALVKAAFSVTEMVIAWAFFSVVSRWEVRNEWRQLQAWQVS